MAAFAPAPALAPAAVGLPGTGAGGRRRRMRARYPSAVERAYLRVLRDRLVLVRRQAEAAIGLRDSRDRVDGARADVGGRFALSATSVPTPNPAELARLGGLVQRGVIEDLERLLGSDLWWMRSGGSAEAIAWAQANVAWIQSIDRRYLAEVAEAVVANATDPERLVVVLAERFGVAESRAALIARDQVGRLYGQLSDSYAARVGLSEYVWRHRPGLRYPRAAHVERDGRAFRRGEVEDEPGVLVGCQCVREWVVRGPVARTPRPVTGGRVRL